MAQLAASAVHFRPHAYTDRVPTFTAALGAGPIVLDGGLGTQLEAQGNDLSSTLWSARLLLDDPEQIRRAHLEYFRAGARVAITASYQVNYEGLAAAGLTSTDADTLLRRSVDVARAAREDAGLTGHDAWVAASIGPYGAARADGSEYTGAYGLSVTELREWHRPRLRALAAAEPDVLAIETLPSLVEVEAVAAELDGLGVPAWLSFTVEGAALRTGESLAEAVRLAASIDEVVAVGVNCCDAAGVTRAISVIRAETDKPVVVYPNSGEHWDAPSRRWFGGGAPIHDMVPEWVAAGAQLVGGCCRVGPSQIAAVARTLASHAADATAPG